mgnify:CR=1 FL=1
MAFLITKETQDTASVGPFCDYPAQALDGSPFMSPDVRVGGKPLPIYDAASLPSIVPGIRRGIPQCTSTGQRVITPTVNTTVFINGRLPAVQGDNATLDGISTPRPLTAPWLSDKIMIGTSGGTNI